MLAGCLKRVRYHGPRAGEPHGRSSGPAGSCRPRAELSRVRRVKFTFSDQFGAGTRRVDYLTLTDRAGVSLTMPRWAATTAVQTATEYQQRHGLPEARISRFAAMGLGLVPGGLRFRTVRMLAVFVVVACYVFAVGYLIVKGIPALAGYHGG